MPHIHVTPYGEASGLARREYEAAMRRAGRIWDIVSIQCQLPEVMRDSMRLGQSIMSCTISGTRSKMRPG